MLATRALLLSQFTLRRLPLLAILVTSLNLAVEPTALVAKHIGLLEARNLCDDGRLDQLKFVW